MPNPAPIIRAWPPTPLVPPPPPPQPPPVLYVRAETYGDGVDIRLVDEKGVPADRGMLLRINDSGIRRYDYISPDIGLPLDDYKRVVLTGE